MSEESNRSPEARRKRVQRLKKMIVLLLIISIAIPIICCVILFGKVHRLNKTLQSLEEQLQQVTELLEAQQMSEVVSESTEEAVGTDTVHEMMGEAQSQGNQEITGVIEKEEPKHRVYITFDDGPSTYTDEILDILFRYDVKATFFVVGKDDLHSQEVMRRIVEEGHSIGTHSYSHVYSEIYRSKESFSEDFERIQNYVYEITNVKSNLYRFPGGSSNNVSKVPMEELVAYLNEKEVVYHDWNIASGDGGGELLEVQELVRNSTEGIENREVSVILLHDAATKRTTVEALPMIIENILALDDTVILPITEDTEPVQHRNLKTK